MLVEILTRGNRDRQKVVVEHGRHENSGFPVVLVEFNPSVIVDVRCDVQAELTTSLRRLDRN